MDVCLFCRVFELLYFHVHVCVHLSVSSLTADQNTHSAWGAFCNFDFFFSIFFFFLKPWLIPKQQIAAVAGVAPHRWSSITSWGAWQDQSRSSFARSQLSHVSFDRSHRRNNSRHCLGGKYCDQTQKCTCLLEGGLTLQRKGLPAASSHSRSSGRHDSEHRMNLSNSQRV